MKKILVILIILFILILVVFAFTYFSYFSKVNVPPTSQKNINDFQIQGMKVEILKQGNGVAAEAGDSLTVDYVATLDNGRKFDSSIDRNKPFDFAVGVKRVIKGWDLGVIGMKVGEKRRLTIPPELAYGPGGFPSAGIPQNATLIFEIELLEINK